LGKEKRVSNFSLLGFYNDLSFTVAWEKSLKSDRYRQYIICSYLTTFSTLVVIASWLVKTMVHFFESGSGDV
jgi:hypothetical protein